MALKGIVSVYWNDELNFPIFRFKVAFCDLEKLSLVSFAIISEAKLQIDCSFFPCQNLAPKQNNFPSSFLKKYIMAQKNTALKLMISDQVILKKIHIIRGQKVMLDKDLAVLYGVPTRRLKEQVKRNLNRFPDRFMFSLTFQESQLSRSQNATLKVGHNLKYLPFAFTEHGVLMLANVLKSGRAVQMSLRIIDVFVSLRKSMMNRRDILKRLEQLETKLKKQDGRILRHQKSLEDIFRCLKEMLNPIVAVPTERNKVGFKRNDEY